MLPEALEQHVEIKGLVQHIEVWRTMVWKTMLANFIVDVNVTNDEAYTPLEVSLELQKTTHEGKLKVEAATRQGDIEVDRHAENIVYEEIEVVALELDLIAIVAHLGVEW